MKVCLLYPDREWNNLGVYYDAKSIVQDLNLNTLFLCAGKEVVTDKGKVTHIQKEDKYICETMKRVMMVPLHTEEEILYRQEILQDCFSREGFIRQLYQVCSEMLMKWDKLGRRDNTKASNSNPQAVLINEIHVLYLFVETLSKVKELFDIYSPRLYSKGLIALNERLHEEFTTDLETNLRNILNDISFYTDVDDTLEDNHPTIKKPHITVECSLVDGLKLSNMELLELSTQKSRYHAPGGAISKIQDYVNSLIPNSIPVQKYEDIWEQSSLFEYTVVDYVIHCLSPFMDSFIHFFDDLHFQLAFYLGAINLKHHFIRFNVEYCLPSVGNPGSYHFKELIDPVMCMEQRIQAVGNSCTCNNQQLLIITGANQGGKSTFLRSMGIAQIMFQSGLLVAASDYKGAIYQDFFTHFTRREDSAMNSGRLDEELKRMSQIIDNVTPGSLILLNESFASTTEKEGSVIAYDIIKALCEADVYVMTVTHLLSFATKVYEESKAGTFQNVAFLSAERLSDGTRTYKMLTHEPELTSFGLDLYNEIMNEPSD